MSASSRRGGRVAEGTRLLSEYGVHAPSRVRIPPSPLKQASIGLVCTEPVRPVPLLVHSSSARGGRLLRDREHDTFVRPAVDAVVCFGDALKRERIVDRNVERSL